MNHLGTLRRHLATADYDALLLLSPANRFYASGFRSSAGAVLITEDGGILLTDARYIEAATAACPDFTVEETGKGGLARRIAALAETMHLRSIGFEEDRVTVGEFEAYQAALGTELRPAGKDVMALRARKAPWEIRLMEEAQRIAERTLEDILELIKPGVTEKDIAAEIIYRLLRHGAENVSFDPIVVSGENSSLPHGVPSGRAFRPGDFITMDFGCVYMGYCSDMTRTVVLGHATDEMRLVYDTVLEAQLAGISAVRAGVPGADVDRAARDVIEAAGYGRYFGHGFGHSLGIEVHEPPSAAPSGAAPLPEGCVVSAEPGIYLPGKFGVRIEDVLCVEEGGCRNLMAAPKALLVL
ncbi:aminopeptidase P family protein [Oscillospiraceae bacterium OttesenSCG-928-F05]|nr:aminopeptidase P family protein [Oscillospiraceae bacterium OttesenSCG-928-F05]